MTATERAVHTLRWHRRQLLLSQRDFAAKAGVNAATLFLIETGREADPRLETMRKICTALGVDWREVSEFRAAMAREGVQP